MRRIIIFIIITFYIFVFSSIVNAKTVIGINTGIISIGSVGPIIGPSVGFGNNIIKFGFNVHFFYYYQTSLLAGLYADWYYLSGKLPYIDPYIAFGAGAGYFFEMKDFCGYFTLSNSFDIYIPNTSMKPFIETGIVTVFAGEGIGSGFIFRSGIKFEF